MRKASGGASNEEQCVGDEVSKLPRFQVNVTVSIYAGAGVRLQTRTQSLPDIQAPARLSQRPVHFELRTEDGGACISAQYLPTDESAKTKQLTDVLLLLTRRCVVDAPVFILHPKRAGGRVLLP